MQISPSDLNLILAALRMQSAAYEQRAKDSVIPREAQKLADFSRACGMLSDRLESEARTPPAPVILRAH